MYIGGDISLSQCIAACENVAFAQEIHAVHIINTDVTCMFIHTLMIFCVVLTLICYIFNDIPVLL